MSTKTPYSFLFVGEAVTVGVAGVHIIVFDSSNGSLLKTTANLPDIEPSLRKCGPVRCATVDGTFKHVVTCGDDKLLRVWDVETLKLLSERKVPKRLTCIKVLQDGKTILISDKFGDVFKFPLHPQIDQEDKPADEDRQDLLVLGHVSLISTFLLMPDEKYIVTADRDEHVRVSCYPKAYIIERFCLGHEKFVSAIHVPLYEPSRLISGGGDPTLRIWDWMSGETVHEVPISDVVLSHVKVKRQKGRRTSREDGEGEGEEWLSSRKKRKARKKAKGKGKQAEEAEADVEEEGLDHEGGDAQGQGQPELVESEAIVCVHRIQSLELEGRKIVLFASVGASAIFYFTFPSPSLEADFVVSALELGKPVLDFICCPDGEILALVDDTWPNRDNSQCKLVRSLSFVEGKLVELERSPRTQLIASLNQNSQTATSKEVESLDLYSMLSSMPKNLEADHDAMEREVPDGEGNVPSGKVLSGKELGRLKRKKLLMERKEKAAAAGASGEDGAEKKSAKKPRVVGEGVDVDTGEQDDPMEG